MGVLKTFTDELRRVQAERETQDLLEVLRRQLSVLTFGDLAGLITSALGKKLAAVKVSALFGPSAGPEGPPSKTPAASAGATPTTTPSKKPRPATAKKAASKSKVKVKAKAKVASKRQAKTSKKAAPKRTSPTAKGKKAAAKANAAPSRPATGAQAAQDQAVLRTLAASAAPLAIRGVVDGAKLSQSQANRTLRRLVAGGAVQMIGPKQRATYTLAQGTGSGSGTARPSATPSPASAPSSSTAAGSKARATGKTAAGSEAYTQAILAGLQGVGDWIRAADLRPKVGGTAEQLRLTLVGLVRDGAILKTGERNGTRYKLAG